MNESKGITAIDASDDRGNIVDDDDSNHGQLDEEEENEIVHIRRVKDEQKLLSPLDRYNSILERKPLLTKAVTSAIIGALGSGVGSLLASSSRSSKGSRSNNHKKFSFHNIDFLQVLTFALHGILVQGPFDHYWSEWLAKHGPKSKGKSLLLDQLVVEPYRLVVMSVFLDTTRSALREISPSLNRTISTVGPTLAHSWRFWPVLIYAIHRFLKKKHQKVATNVGAFLW
eukprot:CAMPEP_0195303560 /NCGR_PEP_ID=MMETSP0707-20130614/33008_1 /TAXON_ID=33640 /ORGANISM="Asterionellopsis glacialis, Strain CCMP134" /LENGTH=227 /DNA_ID=CAMNT_0040367147 /DNA_START=68 /DNA_END=748 /DNA_ORIENTATION=-